MSGGGGSREGARPVPAPLPVAWSVCSGGGALVAKGGWVVGWASPRREGQRRRGGWGASLQHRSYKSARIRMRMCTVKRGTSGVRRPADQSGIGEGGGARCGERRAELSAGPSRPPVPTGRV